MQSVQVSKVLPYLTWTLCYRYTISRPHFNFVLLDPSYPEVKITLSLSVLNNFLCLRLTVTPSKTKTPDQWGLQRLHLPVV